MTQDDSPRGRLVHELQRAQTCFFTLLHQLLPLLTGAPRTLEGSRWRALELSLLSQMDAEERMVLPHMTQLDARNARAMAREHELLRDRLRQVDEAFERGLETSTQLALLAAELRAHALHEHELLERFTAREL